MARYLSHYESFHDTVACRIQVCGPVVAPAREGYVFLSGTIQPTGAGHVSLQDQCFCRDARFGPEGKCFPVAYCGSCDLNRSGECPQENQNLRIPGV